jgi:hypothetical protein
MNVSSTDWPRDLRAQLRRREALNDRKPAVLDRQLFDESPILHGLNRK